jgi:hypothetical protein
MSMSAQLRRRRIRPFVSGAAAATLGASGTLFLISDGEAATSSTPTPVTPTVVATGPGFQVTSDGWVRYGRTTASKLALSNVQTVTENGTFDANGNCIVNTPSQTVTHGGPAAYQSETGYNPKLCEATYEEGFVANSVAASTLGVDTSQPYGLTPVPAGAQAGPAAVIPAPLPGQSLATASGVQPADSTTYKNAYQKDAYIDPLDITITSLADNMSFGVDDSNQILTSYSNWSYGHRFAYDGWSGSSPWLYSYKNNAYTEVFENGIYQGTNTDFEQYLVYEFGPEVYAACGFNSSPANFTQNMILEATASTLTPISQDTATGGCSNLVHRDAESGYGSTQ